MTQITIYLEAFAKRSKLASRLHRIVLLYNRAYHISVAKSFFQDSATFTFGDSMEFGHRPPTLLEDYVPLELLGALPARAREVRTQAPLDSRFNPREFEF